MKNKAIERLRRNLTFLKLLAQKNGGTRKRILQSANNDLLKCICECCFNLVNGNIKLSAKQQKSLKRHKNTVRTLATKKVALKGKRNLLLQSGGGLPAILIPILTVAGSLIADLLRK